MTPRRSPPVRYVVVRAIGPGESMRLELDTVPHDAARALTPDDQARLLRLLERCADTVAALFDPPQ